MAPNLKNECSLSKLRSSERMHEEQWDFYSSKYLYEMETVAASRKEFQYICKKMSSK